MIRPLRDSRTVTLDGSGNGTVTFGPQRAGTSWTVRTASVKVSSNTNESVASLYRGTANPGSLISATYSGSQDTDSNINDNPLFPGEFYTCQWIGGDAGATAIVSFTGVEET